MSTKIDHMLSVLREVYASGGLKAAVAKIDTWQNNGWLNPHEKRILIDSIAFAPGFDYNKKIKR